MAEDDIFYRHQEESLAKEEENESFDDDDDVDDGTEKVPNRKELSPYLHPSVVRKIWIDSQPFQLDAM